MFLFKHRVNFNPFENAGKFKVYHLGILANFVINFSNHAKLKKGGKKSAFRLILLTIFQIAQKGGKFKVYYFGVLANFVDNFSNYAK